MSSLEEVMFEEDLKEEIDVKYSVVRVGIQNKKNGYHSWEWMLQTFSHVKGLVYAKSKGKLLKVFEWKNEINLAAEWITTSFTYFFSKS